MGCWNEYCFICGISVSQDLEYHIDDFNDDEPAFYNFLKKNLSLFKWLDDPTIGILQNNKIVILYDYSCSGSWEDFNRDYESATTYYKFNSTDQIGPLVYPAHKKCIQLLNDNFNRLPTFNEIKSLQKKNLHYVPWNLNYHGAEKYAEQDQMYDKMIADDNLWMAFDPSKSKKNKERIISIWIPWYQKHNIKPNEKKLTFFGSIKNYIKKIARLKGGEKSNIKKSYKKSSKKSYNRSSKKSYNRSYRKFPKKSYRKSSMKSYRKSPKNSHVRSYRKSSKN